VGWAWMPTAALCDEAAARAQALHYHRDTPRMRSSRSVHTHTGTGVPKRDAVIQLVLVAHVHGARSTVRGHLGCIHCRHGVRSCPEVGSAEARDR
jgi:hypothetical protein